MCQYKLQWTTCYNIIIICGLVCDSSEDIASEISEDRHQFSSTPLSFDAPSPVNPSYIRIIFILISKMNSERKKEERKKIACILPNNFEGNTN